MNLLYAIFLTLILAANSEEAKDPVIDEDFCNKKLAEYKQKVPYNYCLSKIYKRLSN